MNIAIIPARGGSKRIPHKNIRLFHGKPMLAWSLAAALASELFDRILVSTDSEDIARVALEHGAEVPFVRPDKLADDYTGTNAVVKHALQWLLEHNEPIEYACCIYATAPFLQPEFLRRGFELLKERQSSFVFSVTSFPYPIQRSLRLLPQGGVEPCFPEHIPKRSQDLEDTYHDAGQFYWGRVDAFLNNLPVFAPAARPLVLPRHLVQDIDTPEDWLRAELMFEAWRAMSNSTQ
ncbi:pseudaminic acid cytidylyltransferase [Thiocystis violacea]|uniref:pseudaminic acid cytidylyltransferase n=1 Tax=Thiocystis violacea TaxID=13725 RepID=UPI0019032E19|nr:pseudaminic acid cytidylyltransferase [Thiocystis violacea]MBK1719493.1 pseudaminic acid cytidylyltransferase [Thiocystis violacea]